ncbi:hypothetical protein [Paenibacillus sp. NFR01]|uniref:hypothetical protein n=1 Tax=Paenibacillus sp. NFR01 TaxID=1566279 RepID=UPI0008AF815C|nr:hypothetical protein [Paenibacillus sp. NFR01]SES87834.1 hypothetical protein SAMN03159358_0184 [Paenibacillus sp. NFR01]
MKFLKRTKEIAILIVTISIAIKFILLDFNSLSLPDNLTNLLAMTLALFSIGLSALFYFKANDTSNSFYNNTYQFTKDISEKIGRIEERFGKDLSNIEKNYSRMLERIDKIPFSESIEEEILDKTLNQNILSQEKEDIINQLIEKANISEDEKSKIVDQLKAKEIELTEVKTRLFELQSQLDAFRNRFELPPHTRNIIQYIIKGIINRGEMPETYSDFLKLVERNILLMDEKDLNILLAEGLLSPEYNLSRIGRKLIIQTLKEAS